MQNYYNMARSLLLTAFALLLAGRGHTQEGGGQFAQRIEAMKVAFITDRLRLTPEEAQQFWPLYNQYEDEEKLLRNRYRPTKRIADMTDQEAGKFLAARLEMEEKMIDLKRTYLNRFQEVIPTKKVAMLNQVEEEFKRELLRRIQEERQEKRKN